MLAAEEIFGDPLNGRPVADLGRGCLLCCEQGSVAGFQLFAPRSVQLGTTAITTIDPRVLLHTFGVFGGVIRRKDIPKVNALADSLRTGRVVSSFTENDCAEFSRYIDARNRSYPLFPLIRRAADDFLEILPPYAASTAKHYLLPGTNWALSRLNHVPECK